jgi:MGT family glycosyltransferase
VSCNPLELKDEALAPVFSGYPEADRTGWAAFRAEYLRAIADLHGSFSEFCVERGAPALPTGELIHESEWLNLYVYPAELDYARERPLADTWQRLDTCVRTSDATVDVPPGIAEGQGGLVYLSLGSLGSADVELMQRLVAELADSPNRFIVSKGPQAAAYELADNMWGAEFLPQPAILPLVDAVITHGGNNTTTECFHAGKPMAALPLFWDQYDNAQRVDETGFGIRLDTYGFADGELRSAVESLLSDNARRSRIETVAARVRDVPGTVRAADLLERVAAG